MGQLEEKVGKKVGEKVGEKTGEKVGESLGEIDKLNLCQNHSKYLHFLFLKNIFVILQPIIFLGFFLSLFWSPWPFSTCTAVQQPLAKYYQLLGLHGRRWRKWRKIAIYVEDHQILPVL